MATPKPNKNNQECLLCLLTTDASIRNIYVIVFSAKYWKVSEIPYYVINLKTHPYLFTLSCKQETSKEALFEFHQDLLDIKISPCRN